MLLPVHITSGRLASVLCTGAVRDTGDALLPVLVFAAMLAGYDASGADVYVECRSSHCLIAIERRLGARHGEAH